MRILTLLPLLLAIAGPVAGKDLTLQQHVTDSASSGESYDMITYLTPSLRAVDGPYNRTVIDAKTQTVTVLDKEEHTFWQTSFESLRRETDEQAASKFNANSKAQIPLTLEPTKVTETIAGHPAVEHALQGASLSGSVWLAKDIESPADPALWKDWQGFGARLGPHEKIADAVRALNGVALRTKITAEGMKTTSAVTTEVTAVREEAPPADLAAIPEGYTRAGRHAFSH